MLNSGCGLCVELCKGSNDRALWVRCEKVGDDVVVKDCFTPFIVATKTDSRDSWEWGHYFTTLEDAENYLLMADTV